MNSLKEYLEEKNYESLEHRNLLKKREIILPI